MSFGRSSGSSFGAEETSFEPWEPEEEEDEDPPFEERRIGLPDLPGDLASEAIVSELITGAGRVGGLPRFLDASEGVLELLLGCR